MKEVCREEDKEEKQPRQFPRSTRQKRWLSLRGAILFSLLFTHTHTHKSWTGQPVPNEDPTLPNYGITVHTTRKTEGATPTCVSTTHTRVGRALFACVQAPRLSLSACVCVCAWVWGVWLVNKATIGAPKSVRPVMPQRHRRMQPTLLIVSWKWNR